MTKIRLALIFVSAALVGGCTSPIQSTDMDKSLRDSILESIRRETREAERRAQTRELDRVFDPTTLGIDEAFYEVLDRMAGPEADQIGGPISYGENLEHEPHRTVGITLDQVRKTVVANNLEVEFARLEPAVQESQVVQAQAAFDWIFFSTLDLRSIDSPRQVSAVQGNVFGVGSDEQTQVDWTAGVRRQLTTGGQFVVQQDLAYSNNQTPGLSLFPDPAYQVAYTVQLDQPLLRNFGSDVALQQVRLARNAERDAIAQLEADLIRTLTDAERAYWDLAFRQAELKIRYRLLARGIEWSDKLNKRSDATQADRSDAAARVESRRAAILRTQNALRAASDQLRVLMNDPNLPIGSEVILLPMDQPLLEPIEYNYFEAMSTAIRNRPEVDQATISLDNTSIRQTVARNLLLPQLDLRLQTRLSALEETAGDAYTDAFDGNFVDWLVGFVFEVPIGNRAAEANLRGTQLQRMQAAIAFRQTIQSIILEVRASLYNLATNYELIGQTKTARINAAESLRSFQVRTENQGRYDAITIANLLNRQEQLALAEAEEIQARVDYNISMAELHAALGLTLERNRIDFVVPTAEEQFDWPSQRE